MKAIIALGLPLLASAAAIEKSLHEHQVDLGKNSPPLVPKVAFSSKKLKPEIDDNAIREQLVWGPFKLTASNGTHGHGVRKLDPNSDVFNEILGGLCSDCMVLSAQIQPTLQNGVRADIGSGVYAHHITVLDTVKKPAQIGLKVPCRFSELLSSQGSGARVGGSLFVAEGDDGAATRFMTKEAKVKRGYYIPKKDTMRLAAELINYKKEDQEIFLALTYEYLPNMPVRDKAYYDVAFSALTSDPCGSPNLYPPANQTTKYTSPVFEAARDGYLVSINPHLHNGAVNMTILVNNQPKCTSSANYGFGVSTGNTPSEKRFEVIMSYTPCEEIEVKKRDNVTLETYYDLNKHQLRPMSGDEKMAEAMAVALYFFASSPVA